MTNLAWLLDTTAVVRTHELERLRPLLPKDWVLPDREPLADLSRFAVAGCYPEGPFDAGPEPTWSDAEEAVRLAESVQTGILAGARSRGIGRRQIEAKKANEKADRATDTRGSKITKTLE